MSYTPEFLKEVHTANLLNSISPFFRNFLEQYKSYQEVEGIVILGGSATTGSRPFLDIYSDLDASLFITVPIPNVAISLKVREFLNQYQHLLPQWLPPFSIIAPCEQHPNGKVEINIHQQIIEYEQQSNRHWDEMKKEAYTEAAEVIFDRNGQVAQLISEKTAWNDLEARHLMLRILGQAVWYGYINPLRQVERGFPYHSQDLLNEALELIVWSVYLLNRKYRPHRKWRLQRSFYLPILPSRFRERMLDAMIISDLSAESIRSRTNLTYSLIEDLTLIAQRIYDLPAECYSVSCVESFDDRQLLRNTALSDTSHSGNLL